MTSINDGSEAYFDYACSPCGEDGTRVEAVKYCPLCQEYLCSKCTRHHCRQNATRSHTLQVCAELMKAPNVAMEAMDIKCRYHPDRQIEMFCEEHDMVYCMKCIVTEHRLCKGVCSLEDIKVSFDKQTEIDRLKTNTTNIQLRLEGIERKELTNIGTIEKQRNDVVSKIEEHARKLKQDAYESLEIKYAMVKEDLQTSISQIRKVKVDIGREFQQIQAVNNLNKKQQFVQTKLVQLTVNDAMKVIEENEDKPYQDLCFIEENELKSTIINSTSLGSVQIVTERNNILPSKLSKVTSKEEVHVQMANEKNICHISDICQLPDGTILLADYNNCRIKRLDINYNIRDSFNVGNFTLGICCTENNEVAVKLCNKVLIISVQRYFITLGYIPVTNWHSYGIACCAGELFVPSENGIDVYSMSGTLLKTISKNVNGRNIFEITPGQMVTSEYTVVITDNREGAVCLARDGSFIRKLRDERLVSTKSVCESNDGKLFIAGYNSQNIIMFERDGKCLGELLEKEGGLKHPVSMCFDKKKNCLLVCNENSNALLVLHMSN